MAIKTTIIIIVIRPMLKVAFCPYPKPGENTDRGCTVTVENNARSLVTY